ncbi:hypothetical protein [Crocosphaera chwakensis]|uniref:Uncharacterized protein n=1 Tax=Crocosphaera chwakensis CCY0110 TaxID=391612 RepID=A3ISQ4_9CHRO|nr:hypothetical protein [Crocosphaera chwakensis]EAZ90474.1 hypothetical protein CY0110_26642 [Crocosphaera chwakensis CCY0110]
MMSINLTEKEAYTAMYAYLVKIYEMTQSDDIGSLLGSMSTLSDGEIVDPAIWDDWLQCIDDVKQNQVDIELRLK